MKWALVLALVLCCGLTRGQTEIGSDESLDKLLELDNLLKYARGYPRADEVPFTCGANQCQNEVSECDAADGEKCKCPAGLSGDDCGTVECDAALKAKCDSIEGSQCIYDTKDKKTTCSCKENQKFNEDKCIAACGANKEHECKNEVSTCENDVCKCPLGLSGDDCGTVECDAALKAKCDLIEGSECIYDTKDKKTTCSCKENQKFNGDKCIAACGANKEHECKNGVSTCENDVCKCPDGLSGDDCGTVNGCDADLKAKCALIDGSECIYDPKEEKKATCKCEENQKFKGDKCIAFCGKGDKKFECKNGVNKCTSDGEKCECPVGELSGDDCGIVTGCTTLKATCDNLKLECIYDKTAPNKATCDCKDEKLKFDVTNCKAVCGVGTSQIICQNGVTSCTDGGKCDCPEGLSGDNCETVTGCTTLNVICEKLKLQCIYDKTALEKATCDCNDKNKKFDGKNCKAACGEGDNQIICKNGATKCTSDGKCECPADELSGDDCSEVAGCTGELKDTCEGLKLDCIYDPTAKDKATCDCKDTNKKFDGKVCADTCGGVICQNGAPCESNKCKCPEGLKGDDCGQVAGCTDDLKKICEGISSKCIYDPTRESKAACECVQEKEEFDGKICKECDCGDEKQAKSCKFDKDGNKVCVCVSAMFAVHEGKCTACDCGDKTSTGCEFKDDGKVCKCQSKNSQKGDTCEECDCGSYGKCSFDGTDKKCKCDDRYSEKDGTCQSCDCGKNGECSFDGDGGKKKCSCHKGYVENGGTCKECDCGENGECTLENNKKTCDCHSGYKPKGGKCIATCGSDSDCGHETKCAGTEEAGKFCDCGKENLFTGDKCELVVECEAGNLKECKNSGGTCTYTKGKGAECSCEGEKAYDKDKKMCRKKCSSKLDCKNGAECTKELCACPTGTDGDDCSTVKGCTDELKKECESAKATCVYGATSANNAKCDCGNEDLTYSGKKCIAKWCEMNPCKVDVSECDYSYGAGYCKCKDTAKTGKYYDYTSNACIDVNKCPLTSCKTNYDCRGGMCKCFGFYEEVTIKDSKEKECNRKKLCTAKTCYTGPGVDCEEGEIIGTYKCACQENFFYNPKSKACEDGKCFLPGKRENCTASCGDSKLARAKEGENKGECVPNDDKKKCDINCGPFGVCVKDAKDKDTCICTTTFAAPNKEGVCVLDKDKACASGKVKESDPNKCECSGSYKFSKNEITCEPLSCGDEEAQDDCKAKSKEAFCVNLPDSETKMSYTCKCPAGKTLTNKGCVDLCSTKEALEKCSINQQSCYVNEKGDGDCKCPPGFEANSASGTCEPSAKNAYLLKQLPVMNSGFLNADNSVNKVKLNADIMQSMKLVYTNLDYGFLQSYSTSGDVILCDVWLNFKADTSTAKTTLSDVKRWRSQILEVKDKGTVLPPALLLSSAKLENVVPELLGFCSDIVKQTACGQGSTCDVENKACSCEAGYKVIGPTMRKIGENTILRCEDINECQENMHNCKSNSKCRNTIGSYTCECEPGYHKKNADESQGECVELCSPNPCQNGDCKVNENKVECSCKVGFKGSYCTESDDKLKQAQHSTKVVGAVLGTILAVTFVAIIVYIVRLKKNSYSEDFSPAPRDNSEMVERNRPLRGVSNRGYQ